MSVFTYTYKKICYTHYVTILSKYETNFKKCQPDPFLPLSMSEYPSFPGYRFTTRHDRDSCETNFSNRFTFLLRFCGIRIGINIVVAQLIQGNVMTIIFISFSSTYYTYITKASKLVNSGEY